MGSAAAISLTGLSPSLSRRKMSRRCGSPSASNGSPAARAWIMSARLPGFGP